MLLFACSSGGDQDASNVDAGPRDVGGLDLGEPQPDAGRPDIPSMDAGASDLGDPSDSGPSDTGASDAGQANLPLSNVIASVAQATCEGLFRCCDARSFEQYFSAHANHPRLMETYAGRLPPAASVTAAQCPSLLEEMLEIVPLGPWVRAAQAGQVDYDPASAQACLAALSSATCGASLTEALFDGNCFSFTPPAGGVEQRRMFSRAAAPGTSCVPLADGVGGGLYGTCDPSEAFCCIPSDTDPNICRVRDAPGTCQAASDVGEPCALFPSAQICKTGLVCGAGDTCEMELDGPLSNGQPCFDDVDFMLLGRCTDGYCDVLGTDLCEPRKALGQPCQSADECLSRGCEMGVCAEPTFCTAP